MTKQEPKITASEYRAYKGGRLTAEFLAGKLGCKVADVVRRLGPPRPTPPGPAPKEK
jgi:hypothetical protein